MTLLRCLVRRVVCVGRASEKSVSASSAAARAIAAATESLKTSGESEVSSSLAPPLPSSLRRRLVLDWERLTRRQQIARLPARLPVLTLLAAFLHDHQANRAGEQAAAAAAAADADSAKQEAVLQVCEGLLCYFERCLPAVLLYRIERPQMTQLAQQHSLVLPAAGQVNDPPLFSLQHMTHTLPRPPATVLPSSYPSSSSSSSPPLSVSAPPTALTHWLPEPSAASASFASAVPQWSGVYGVEHLIRLLCKLPAILRDGEAQWMDEQRLAVRYTLTALYRWLSAHDELIYGYSAYEHPSSDYMYKLQQPHHAASYSDESVRHSDEQQQQQQQRGSGLKQLSRAQAQSPNKASNVKRDKR